MPSFRVNTAKSTVQVGLRVNLHPSHINANALSGTVIRLDARVVPGGLTILAFAASFQLVPGELAEGVRDLVLTLGAAVEVDHRGSLAVVAYAVYQLPEGRLSAFWPG